MVSKADAVEQRERRVSEQRKPWFGQNAHSVAEAMESDAEGGLSRTEAGRAAVPLRAEPDREREAAVHVGGRSPAAPRPVERHARGRRRGEPGHR